MGHAPWDGANRTVPATVPVFAFFLLSWTAMRKFFQLSQSGRERRATPTVDEIAALSEFRVCAPALWRNGTLLTAVLAVVPYQAQVPATTCHRPLRALRAGVSKREDQRPSGGRRFRLTTWAAFRRLRRGRPGLPDHPGAAPLPRGLL